VRWHPPALGAHCTAQPRRPRRGNNRGVPAAPRSHRSNSVITRNARLAAIHSFYSYAALHAPEHATIIQQVLAIPAKRVDRAIVSYLTRTECDALIAAPDTTSWLGRRDHTLLLVATHTGLRVSELISLTIADISLGAGPHVRCTGQGELRGEVPAGAGPWPRSFPPNGTLIRLTGWGVRLPGVGGAHWVCGRHAVVVVQGVPVPGGDHQSLCGCITGSR
jgi:integrase